MDLEALVEAVRHPAGVRSREAVARALAPAFGRASQLLNVGGSLIGSDRPSGRSPSNNGDDRVVGLSLVAGMAGQLCSGVVVLLDQGNVYAGAALVRQLVEVEYLAWAFAEDDTEAAAWLRASPDERKKRWTAGPLLRRSGGKFCGSDYMHHCQMGGHPTPRGSDLLFNDSDAPQWWFEVVTHGVNIRRYIREAASKTGYLALLDDADPPRSLDDLIGDWRGTDPAVPLLARPRPSATEDPAGWLRSLVVT